MRGAVLHKVGLKFVKERFMRRHYGVEFRRRPFYHESDPQHLFDTDPDGEEVCKDVLQWYATKVLRSV
jgi:hypothetical protein